MRCGDLDATVFIGKAQILSKQKKGNESEKRGKRSKKCCGRPIHLLYLTKDNTKIKDTKLYPAGHANRKEIRKLNQESASPLLAIPNKPSGTDVGSRLPSVLTHQEAPI